MNDASFGKPFYRNIATKTKIVTDSQSQTSAQHLSANIFLTLVVSLSHHSQNWERST